MNVCLLLSSFERTSQWFGGDSEEVTPVPMPNTEVKLFSADGSRGFPPVRVGRRQAIITVKAAHYELPFLFISIASGN